MNAEKETEPIADEIQNSSTLLLIRELTRWDMNHHHADLTAIANELKNRISRKKIRSTLFIVCVIQANLLEAFSEHFYPFDEDEKEIRRQLKIGISTHLTVILIISLLYFMNSLIPLVVVIAYLIFTFNWAISGFKQTSKLINNP